MHPNPTNKDQKLDSRQEDTLESGVVGVEGPQVIWLNSFPDQTELADYNYGEYLFFKQCPDQTKFFK
jgi:hypothetical protein